MAIHKAIASIAQDRDRLPCVDESAPRDHFRTGDERATGPNVGTPVLDHRIPVIDTTVGQYPMASRDRRRRVRPSGVIGHSWILHTGALRDMKGEDAMSEGRERARKNGGRAPKQVCRKSEVTDWCVKHTLPSLAPTLTTRLSPELRTAVSLGEGEETASASDGHDGGLQGTGRPLRYQRRHLP